MYIRRAGPEDAQTVVEIVRQAFAGTTHDGVRLSGAEETAEGVLADLEYKGIYLLCRQTDDYAVATLRLHVPPGTGYLYITRVAVRPEWQRRGLAGGLLAFAETEALRCGWRTLRLDTPRDHARLVRFYQNHGFLPAEQTTLPGRSYPSLILERALDQGSAAQVTPAYTYAPMT